MDFTKNQINDYRAYEKVRKAGHYNMISSQARAAAMLTREEHLFVMENYSELKDASEAAAANEMLLKQTDHS
jgi:hypothetical protein